MKLIIIFGPHAVGKMTVGQELAKKTELKLFHNHMTIDLVANFFDFGTEQGRRLVGLFRQEIFEEVSKSNLYGIIFTFMWAFDQQADWDYVESVCNIFKRYNADIYFVELVAPQEVRLQRNITENRLKHKASKQDIEISNQRLINADKIYRCVSNDGEIPFENYMKIDNSNLSAELVATIIKERFNL